MNKQELTAGTFCTGLFFWLISIKIIVNLYKIAGRVFIYPKKCIIIYIYIFYYREAKVMDLNKLKEMLMSLEMEDIFPMYGWNNDSATLLKASGIYLGIIVAAILLIFLLGWIFILGIIIKIISTVAILYGVVGMVAGLLRFMKYN